jgi:hypothetical protein
MSLTGQLYRLQQLDIELEKKLQELSEVNHGLSDNEVLATAESKLSSHKDQLESVSKKQRSSEWELADLQEKIRQIDSRLYSGTTKDPKELVNLEKEVKGLKSQIKAKEDALLDFMSQMEEIEANTKTAIEEVERLKQEWEQRQETLGERKGEIEALLAKLKADRVTLVQQLDSEALDTYERVKLSRGQAVAKVERGECQGCHIAVPTSQWQRVKAGDLIQCNSCSRILCVE